jgi:hypothetical protein
MFEREPNIDIVFRNGLRDLEALPPSEVWDNIPPMSVRGSRYRWVVSIAASIAVLVTFTLLASRITRSNGTGSDNLTGVTLADNDLQAFTEPPRSVSPQAAVTVTSEVPGEDTAPVINPEHETIIPGTGGRAMLSLASQFKGGELTGEEKTASQNSSLEGMTIISQDMSPVDSYSEQLLASDKPAADHQRFIVGASMAPSLAFSASGNDTQLDDLFDGEKIRPAYSTGLAFGYQISPRLTIQSGIGIASMGQIINGIDVYAGLADFYAVKSDYLYSVQTSSGLILTGNPDLYLSDSRNRVETMIPGNMADPSKYPLTQVGNNIHQVFRYLELPLLIRYKVIDRGIGINFSGGMAYGFLVDNFAYTGSGSEMIPVGHTEGVNVHSLSSQVGLGMEYNISGRFTFNVEPVFRYYVTPFNDLSGTLYKPYSFGLFSGFFYKF